MIMTKAVRTVDKTMKMMRKMIEEAIRSETWFVAWSLRDSDKEQSQTSTRINPRHPLIDQLGCHSNRRSQGKDIFLLIMIQ